MTRVPADIALSQRWKILLAFIVLLAASEFVIRGPARALLPARQFNDLLSPYVQTQLWIHGYDPYSPVEFLTHWPASAGKFPFSNEEASNGSMIRDHGIPTAYPPFSFVVLAPFAVLPWPFARTLWAASSVGLFVLMIWALVSITDLRSNQRRWWTFLIFALALAPFHTGIAIENIGIAATEFGVIAIWTARKERNLLTGMLLTLAICLKPQIGLCFFVFYLLERRWRIAVATAAMTSAIAFLAVTRMIASGIGWVPGYLFANKTLFVTGSMSTFTAENPTRYGLINLQVIFENLLHTQTEVNLCALGIAAVLACIFLSFWRSSSESHSDTELMQISAIVVISLLPIYHRFYDASLLIIPASLFVAGKCIKRVPARLGLTLIFPFFVPGGSMLEVLQSRGSVSSLVTETWWWNLIVMPHQIWCLLLLSILLLYGVRPTEFLQTSGCNQNREEPSSTKAASLKSVALGST